MTVPTAEAVRHRAAALALGTPLVQNNLRAIVVEAIVELALQPTGRWCGSDWSGRDFQHEDGTRLEVKQSAARQTWTAPAALRPPRFDISERTGFYEGAAWTARPGRQAQLYVFALHPVLEDSAVQRGRLASPQHSNVVGGGK